MAQTMPLENRHYWQATFGWAVDALADHYCRIRGAGTLASGQRATLADAERNFDKLERYVDQLVQPVRAEPDWTGEEGKPGPASRERVLSWLFEGAMELLADKLARERARREAAEGTMAHWVGGTEQQDDAVADDHWSETNGAQTLRDYIGELPPGREGMIAACIRLLFATASRVRPAGGGYSPYGFHVQVDDGNVGHDVREADLPRPGRDDWDNYVDSLLPVFRPIAEKLITTLADSWNALSIPDRRVVLTRWDNLRLKTRDELAAIYGDLDLLYSDQETPAP
jgi:hypothetical protein